MHHHLDTKRKSAFIKPQGQQGHSYLLSLFLYGLFLVLMLCLSVKYAALLQDCGWLAHLDAALIEQEQFRAMDFGEEGLSVIEATARENHVTIGEAAAVWMIHYGYHLPGIAAMEKQAQQLWDQTTTKFLYKKGIVFEVI